MVEIGGYCLLQGDTFSPAKVEEQLGIHFEKKNEPGEIATSGRYRGKPLPFGSAQLVLARRSAAEQSFPIDPRLFDLLKRQRGALAQLGATDIVVHFDIAFSDQCNFEMSPEFLKALTELDVPVSFTCYPA